MVRFVCAQHHHVTSTALPRLSCFVMTAAIHPNRCKQRSRSVDLSHLTSPVLFPRKLAQSPHFRRKAIGSIIFT